MFTQNVGADFNHFDDDDDILTVHFKFHVLLYTNPGEQLTTAFNGDEQHPVSNTL